MEHLILNMQIQDNLEFFNVLASVIQEVVVAVVLVVSQILICSVDKVGWVYDFADKVELEVRNVLFFKI